MGVMTMTAGQKILCSLQGQKERQKQMSLEFARSPMLRTLTAKCEESGVAVSLEVEDIDRLGVLLSRVTLSVDGSVSQSAERFNERIERLTGGVHSLRVIECEVGSLYALLRTAPVGESDVRYFEITLDDTVATLEHFVVAQTSWRRRLEPVNLSIMGFVDLVDRLVDGVMAMPR
jgi:hypothetical protein